MKRFFIVLSLTGLLGIIWGIKENNSNNIIIFGGLFIASIVLNFISQTHKKITTEEIEMLKDKYQSKVEKSKKYKNNVFVFNLSSKQNIKAKTKIDRYMVQWHCEFCGNVNDINTNICHNCGASKTSNSKIEKVLKSGDEYESSSENF